MLFSVPYFYIFKSNLKVTLPQSAHVVQIQIRKCACARAASIDYFHGVKCQGIVRDLLACLCFYSKTCAKFVLPVYAGRQKRMNYFISRGSSLYLYPTDSLHCVCKKQKIWERNCDIQGYLKITTIDALANEILARCLLKEGEVCHRRSKKIHTVSSLSYFFVLENIYLLLCFVETVSQSYATTKVYFKQAVIEWFKHRNQGVLKQHSN